MMPSISSVIPGTTSRSGYQLGWNCIFSGSLVYSMISEPDVDADIHISNKQV